MTGIVRRINVLTVLGLLLSGLLQPLAAAQGVTCSRMHAPLPHAVQHDEPATDAIASVSDGLRMLASPHSHDTTPRPGVTGAPSASCGGVALPAEHRPFSPVITDRRLLQMDELPSASLLIQSLFRPPRLS